MEFHSRYHSKDFLHFHLLSFFEVGVVEGFGGDFDGGGVAGIACAEVGGAEAAEPPAGFVDVNHVAGLGGHGVEGGLGENGDFGAFEGRVDFDDEGGFFAGGPVFGAAFEGPHGFHLGAVDEADNVFFLACFGEEGEQDSEGSTGGQTEQ